MPAIAPSYLNCTVYLYPSRKQPEDGTAAGGSGFLVATPSRHEGRVFIHAVTNGHVVNNGNHVIRINTRDGRSEIVQTEPGEWIVSPDDDLAVFPLELPQEALWNAITPDTFLGDDCEIEGWPIFPGDEVFFYGRFTTHDGRERNRPVMRFGNISMLPDTAAPVRLEGDREQVAFLVECRSLSGFSGSPAFVHLAEPRLMEPGSNKQGYIPSTFRFLGVDCAHLSSWAPVRERKDRSSVLPDRWVETNSGIAVIIPAWRLRHLLNDERLVEERERIDRLLDKG